MKTFTGIFAVLLLMSAIPAAAATQSADEQAAFPRIAQNQTRPADDRPTDVVANCCFNQDPGPGPGNDGASECMTDTVCLRSQGNKCSARTGLKCYAWLTADGLRCAAC